MSGDTELLVGQNLSLSCAYPEAVSLWWEKVGGALPSGAVQTSHGTNSSQLLLVVLGVTEQDGGQYVCRANTSGGQVVDSEAVSVTVFGEPTLTLALCMVRCIFPLLFVRTADCLQCDEKRRFTGSGPESS